MSAPTLRLRRLFSEPDCDLWRNFRLLLLPHTDVNSLWLAFSDHVGAVDEDIWPPEKDFDDFDAILSYLLANGSADLIYRGQKRYDWSLTCTLSRALDAEAERKGPSSKELRNSMARDAEYAERIALIETTQLRFFMERAEALGYPNLPAPSDRLGWWEIMQHHEAPTRLLDWTRSPFIALWFAFFGHSRCDGDAALWVYNTRRGVHPRLPVRADPGSEWSTFLDDRRWQNLRAERAIAEGDPAPVVIRPRQVVPRVAAQQSVLTLIPIIDQPTSSSSFVLKTMTTRIRLRASWGSEVMTLCEGMGLTRSALMCDLDSVGLELTDRLEKAPLPRAQLD